MTMGRSTNELKEESPHSCVPLVASDQRSSDSRPFTGGTLNLDNDTTSVLQK